MRNKTLMTLALVFGAVALSACGGDKAADDGDQATQEEAQTDTPTDESSNGNSGSANTGETPDVIGDELEDGVEEAEDMVKEPEGDEE